MFRPAAGLLFLLILVGCQPATETPVLPTLADLDALSTDVAATTISIATPTRRPLPPTFTPSPTLTQTPADPASLPTPTPEGFRLEGTIYFIFNGDAIVELAADASFEDLLPIPHIGQDVSGLSLSPDGRWLAYVAPGAGSAREIYITDRSGSNTGQLSQLGFSEIERPVWHPDSNALAFIAAQSPSAPRGIYTIFADGTGQQLRLQLPSTELRDVTWNHDGSRLFFADTTVFGLDLTSQQISPALSVFGGFGSDFSLAHSPIAPELYFLRPWTNLDTGQRGGLLYFMDTEQLDEEEAIAGAELYADSLAYSANGEYLLIASSEGVWVQTQSLQTASKILQDLPLPPRPALSPDAEQVAYIAPDNQGVEQVFKIDRRSGEASQLTFHQEGSVSDLVWAAG